DTDGQVEVGGESPVQGYVFCIHDGDFSVAVGLCTLPTVGTLFYGGCLFCHDDAEFQYQYLYTDTCYVCIPGTYHVLLCDGFSRCLYDRELVDRFRRRYDRYQKYTLCYGRYWCVDRALLLYLFALAY